MRDFTGFKFGDWHTDNCNIIRVSGGDRYNETLHPEIKDKIVEVPGMNGSYYFGSDYGPMQFEIEIAFDHLTESQFRELRRTFGTKEIKKLIFDERPYKYYMAKLADPIELSYVCFDERKRTGTETSQGVRRNRDADYYEPVELSFHKDVEIPAGETVVYDCASDHLPVEDKEIIVATQPVQDQYVINGTEITFDNTEGEENQTASVSFWYMTEVLVPQWEQVEKYTYSDTTERIYKGDGKISLIAYFPFAKSEFKTLPLNGDIYYEKSSLHIPYERVEDWAVSSGILSKDERTDVDKYIAFTGNSNGFYIYNPGDLPTGFRLYCPFEASYSLSLTYKESLDSSDSNSVFLNIDEITPQSENEIGFLVDTNVGLIYGVKEKTFDQYGNVKFVTSNVYNQYVASGYFFKIKPHLFKEDRSQIIVKDIHNQTISSDSEIEIFYDYLYF